MRLKQQTQLQSGINNLESQAERDVTSPLQPFLNLCLIDQLAKTLNQYLNDVTLFLCSARSESTIVKEFPQI